MIEINLFSKTKICENPDVKKMVSDVSEELGLKVKQVVVTKQEEIKKYHLALQGDIVVLPKEVVNRFEEGEIDSEELTNKVKESIA